MIRTGFLEQILKTRLHICRKFFVVKRMVVAWPLTRRPNNASLGLALNHACKISSHKHNSHKDEAKSYLVLGAHVSCPTTTVVTPIQYLSSRTDEWIFISNNWHNTHTLFRTFFYRYWNVWTRFFFLLLLTLTNLLSFFRLK